MALGPSEWLTPEVRAPTREWTDGHLPGRADRTVMAVTLPADVLFRYRRFTLYNSPYVAHDRTTAVDLYPETGVPSPVAGEVLDSRTVRAPARPHAATHDHLLLVDTGEHVARLLHVDPAVDPGETVAVGDELGDLVRAGFFAPWVPEHVHLGFRPPDGNPYRASGSVPLVPGADLRPVAWDGRGTVLETGETWARLDAPGHPAPGEVFAGLDAGGAILDGGFPHYARGGVLGTDVEQNQAVTLAGTEVGVGSGRGVTWHDCTVRANGQPVTGLALFCGRDSLAVKLVGENLGVDTGDDVVVSVERHDRATQ